jgi:transcription termination/antitermination protein NusA
MSTTNQTVSEGALKEVITAVSREKNVDKAVIIDALEQAVIHAARRNHGPIADLEAHYNADTDEIELFQFRTVVDDVADEDIEIDIEDAVKLDAEAQMGDSLGVKLDKSAFGRIAAQSAKQIIVQKVRDAERLQVYDEFKDRLGEILSGTIRRFERNDIVVDLGATEAIIPYREQIPTEKYKIKDRVQGYVLEVKRSSRGPQVVMSRAHSGFVIRLFEQNVTEVYDGIVTIESAARDPGFRTKVAVHSRDKAVDPVGACVGLKGARVESVRQELAGEKIDIVPWDSDPARFVCNALHPAVVTKVIVDEDNHSMEVIVADDQLSLAIGKRGQNVRLAAQLTGWRLDIKSEARLSQELVGTKELIASIPGIGIMRAEILVHEGIKTLADVSEMSPRTFVRLLNMNDAEASAVVDAAKEMLASGLAMNPAKPAMVNGDHDEFLANASADPTRNDAPRTASNYDNARAERIALFLELDGVGEATAYALADAGYGTIGDLMADAAEEVSSKSGLALSIARTVQMAADRYLQR